MIRCKDPAILNYFLNHKDIYNNIAPDGIEYIDGSTLLASPDTYFFTFPHGSLLFLKCGDTIFKGDCYFLSRKRGTEAKNAAKACIEYMFSVIKADRIIAEVPDFNKASKYFVSSLGFKRINTLENAWLKNGISYDVIVYELGDDKYS